MLHFRQNSRASQAYLTRNYDVIYGEGNYGRFNKLRSPRVGLESVENRRRLRAKSRVERRSNHTSFRDVKRPSSKLKLIELLLGKAR